MTPTHVSTDSARAVGPLLVLAAMPEESAPVITRLEGPTELRTPFIGGVSAVRGMLAGVESVVVTTGIGIAAATAAATWGILAHAPRAVVAAGSCGGLAADVEVGTLIVGDSFTYSIADATAFGYAPGQVPGRPRAPPRPRRLGRPRRARRRGPSRGGRIPPRSHALR